MAAVDGYWEMAVSGGKAMKQQNRARAVTRDTRVWDAITVAIMLTMAGLTYGWLLPR